MTAINAMTPLCIQFEPEGAVVHTTWESFRAANRDGFTSGELDELADELAEGEPVCAGMAMVWIDE